MGGFFIMKKLNNMQNEKKIITRIYRQCSIRDK